MRPFLISIKVGDTDTVDRNSILQMQVLWSGVEVIFLGSQFADDRWDGQVLLILGQWAFHKDAPLVFIYVDRKV